MIDLDMNSLIEKMKMKILILSALLCSCSGAILNLPQEKKKEEVVTVGDVCASVGKPLCYRLKECKFLQNQEETIETCYERFKPSCCVNDKCDSTLPSFDPKALIYISTGVSLMTCREVAYACYNAATFLAH
jgi:hypothetical protein